MKHIKTACIALGLLTFSSAFAKVTVSEPWARATVDGQKMGGAFLTLTNPDNQAATLVAASSPVAHHLELHTMQNVDGMMQMKQIDGIEIAAHQSVTLAPKALHIMFMGLKQTLKAGEMVPMVLTVKQNGKTQKLKIKAIVRALGQ